MIDEIQSRRSQGDCILIVEDEKLVAWDIEQTLHESGFESVVITPTLSGARATLEAQRQGIALVMLDLKLEDGDGAELIDEVLQHGIPVFVVTGYSNFHHDRVPVLYKPFLSADLIGNVISLLGDDR